MGLLLKKTKRQKRKSGCRYLSVCLVLLLLACGVPQLAWMVNPAIAATDDGVITSFEQPVTQLFAPVGTEASDLLLPETLVANLEDDSTRSIPVVWEDGGLYDKNQAGVYTFTADIGAYTYAQPRPIAEVTLSEAGDTHAIILSFDALDEMFAQELPVAQGVDLADIPLPDALAATVKRGELTASESVPVTWACDPAYDGEVIGSYLLTPVLPEGYAPADGVSLPQIVIAVVDPADLIRPLAAYTYHIGGNTFTEDLIQQVIKNYLTNPNCDTLEITGSKTNVMKQLNIEIPAGKKLIWNATYQAAPTYGDNLTMIRLNNLSGTFEVGPTGNITGNKHLCVQTFGESKNGHVVVNGGQISAAGVCISDTGGANITVKGGSVAASGNGSAILAYDVDYVTVSGGIVKSDSSNALYVSAAAAQVTVNGTAQVISVSGVAVNVGGADAQVTVGGGATVSSGYLTLYASGANAQVTVEGDAQVSGSSRVIDMSGANAQLTVGGDAVVSGASTIISDGSVEIKGNAEIKSNGGDAITAKGPRVTVKDNALVHAAGTLYTNGIFVESGNSTQVAVLGGKVSSATGDAIYNNGTGDITVSGGEVVGQGTFAAISAPQTACSITVTGTGKVTAASLSGTTNAIDCAGSVTVSGDGVVLNKSDTGKGIFSTNGPVAVNENGKVEGGGYGIDAPIVTVSGGEVYSRKSSAIYGRAGSGSKIDISGGKVWASAATAVHMLSGASSSPAIVVSGDATVFSTASAGMAIYYTGANGVEIKGNARVYNTGANHTVSVHSSDISVSGNATVECTGTGNAILGNAMIRVSGGRVLAKQGNALNSFYGSGRCEVSGGLVFAYGSEITGGGNVVHNFTSFTVTGDGVVIGWDEAKGVREYRANTEKHISLQVHPSVEDTAKAYWDYGPSPADYTDGITYKNGSNQGFIELPVELFSRVEVTVSKMIAGAYANMQSSFDFKLIFTDDAGAPITTKPSFGYVGGKDPATTATPPPDDTITLDGDGAAVIRLSHGQRITLKVPLGCYLEIKELLPTGSRYAPSIDLSIGAVNEPVTGNTTGRREISDDTVAAFTNTFEIIVPTGIAPEIDTGRIFLFAAVILAFASILPTAICRRRRGSI